MNRSVDMLEQTDTMAPRIGESMDAVALVAGQVVATLGPFLPQLIKAGQNLAESGAGGADQPGWQLARAVWAKLHPKVEQRPAAQAAAQDLAAQPNDADNVGSFRKELRRLLADDPQLARELAALFEQADKSAPRGVTADRGGVAIGRDASGSVIITGNQNEVQQP